MVTPLVDGEAVDGDGGVVRVVGGDRGVAVDGVCPKWLSADVSTPLVDGMACS